MLWLSNAKRRKGRKREKYDDEKKIEEKVDEKDELEDYIV